MLVLELISNNKNVMYRNKNLPKQTLEQMTTRFFLNVQTHRHSPDKCQRDDIVCVDGDGPVAVPAVGVRVREVRRKDKA